MDSFSIWQSIVDASFVVKVVLLLLVVLMITTWAVVFYIRKTFLESELADQEFLTAFTKEANSINSLEKFYQMNNMYQLSGCYYVFKEVYNSLVKFNDQLVDANKGTIFSNYTSLDKNYLDRTNVRAQSEFVLLLDRRRGLLATIANLSPFIGLFGTVIGIVHSFGSLSGGGGSIETIAPGIAEALVATAVGIGTSIPASWFYNIFTSRLQRHKSKLQNFGLETLNLLDRLVITYKKGNND